MAAKINPRKDFVEVAHNIFQQASGDIPAPLKPTKAQEDGKKGGLGGNARKAALTPEQRSEIAKTAAVARWNKT